MVDEPEEDLVPDEELRTRVMWWHIQRTAINGCNNDGAARDIGFDMSGGTLFEDDDIYDF